MPWKNRLYRSRAASQQWPEPFSLVDRCMCCPGQGSMRLGLAEVWAWYGFLILPPVGSWQGRVWDCPGLSGVSTKPEDHELPVLLSPLAEPQPSHQPSPTGLRIGHPPHRGLEDQSQPGMVSSYPFHPTPPQASPWLFPILESIFESVHLE